jgi:hypothetical protein
MRQACGTHANLAPLLLGFPRPNRYSESTIDNRIENSLSIGAVRVNNTIIAANNRVTCVRSLRIADETRRNNEKEEFRLRNLFDASIPALYADSKLVFIN